MGGSGESPGIFCSIWHLPHGLLPFFPNRSVIFLLLPYLLFLIFPEGIKLWDRKEHKWTNKQKAKRNYFCIGSCRTSPTPFKWNWTAKKILRKMGFNGKSTQNKRDFASLVMFCRSSWLLQQPCSCVSCPECRDHGHGPVLISILKIVLHGELTILSP